MPKQEESKTVNYSKDQMFDLVADIDRYDEFLMSKWIVVLPHVRT